MSEATMIKPQKVTVIIDNGEPFTVDVSGEPLELDMTDEEAEEYLKEVTESGEGNSLEARIAGAIIDEIEKM